MKATCWAIGLGMFMATAALPAATAEAVLQEVRLYREGGEAIRVVRVEGLGPGEAIVVTGLPGSLEPEGMQARVRSGDGLRLGAVQFERLNPAELPKSPARAGAEAELRRIEQALEDAAAPAARAGRRAKLHADLRAALLKAMEQAPGGELDARLWEALAGEQAALEEKQALERAAALQIAELREAKAKAERALQEARRIEAALNGRLTIETAGAAAGPVELELRGRFAGAGWQPQYRIDARPVAAQWGLVYQARVRNHTGEAWEAVRLTLLTGRPSWRTQAPELPPVYLEKPRPPAAYPVERGVLMESKADMLAAAPPVEAERLTTQFVLMVPGTVRVGAFADGQVVTLAERTVPATFWSATTPALEETAYLHGEATLELDWPLLPGPATLLVDGAVTGSTTLPFTNPGETVELGFGENPAIEVAFKVLAVQARDTGLIDRVRRYARHYEATVRNRMPVPHMVRVNSRFPVSRDGQIEVRRLAPTDQQVDAETGRFSWQRELAAGAEAVFTTRFEVVAPRDWDVPQLF